MADKSCNQKHIKSTEEYTESMSMPTANLFCVTVVLLSQNNRKMESDDV